MRKEAEPVLAKHGLSWKEAEPLLDEVFSSEALEAARGNPDALLKKLVDEAGRWEQAQVKGSSITADKTTKSGHEKKKEAKTTELKDVTKGSGPASPNTPLAQGDDSRWKKTTTPEVVDGDHQSMLTKILDIDPRFRTQRSQVHPYNALDGGGAVGTAPLLVHGGGALTGLPIASWWPPREARGNASRGQVHQPGSGGNRTSTTVQLHRVPIASGDYFPRAYPFKQWPPWTSSMAATNSSQVEAKGA